MAQAFEGYARLRGASVVDEESPLYSKDRNAGSNDKSVTSAGALFTLVNLALVLGISIHWSLVGWFGNQFSSRTLFTYMVLCTFLPGPPLVVMQMLVDSRYTTQFGAEGAYVFRIGTCLVVVGACTILNPFCEAIWQVSSLGICLGLVSRAGLSSTVRLASAIDPAMNRYVLLGAPLSQAVPIALTFLMSFKSDSSKTTALLYCGIPAAIIFVVACCFFAATILYFRNKSVFDDAYRRLHDEATNQQARSFVEMWMPEASTNGWYYVRHVFQWFLDTFPFPFVTYAGSYDLASHLVLSGFAGQLVGAFFALFSPSLLTPFGKTHLPSPAHEMVIILQVLLLTPFFVTVFYGPMRLAEWSQPALLFTFAAAYACSRFAASENTVAAVKAVAPSRRPAVSLALQLSNATIQLLAVFLAWFVIWISGLK